METPQESKARISESEEQPVSSAGGGSSSTPYDDAWRTLTIRTSRLLIPLVNEIFGENFSDSATVTLLPNEHFLPDGDGKGKKRITDTSFTVLPDAGPLLPGDRFLVSEGAKSKHYLIECESTPVTGAILVKIFEYAIQSGIDQEQFLQGKTLTISIPRLAIFSLRSNRNTPDKMDITLSSEGGRLSIPVHVLKLADYSKEEIFEKKLYLLLPFFLFRYEHQFQRIQEDETAFRALLEEFRSIFQEIDTLLPTDGGSQSDSLMDLFTSKALREMTHTVVDGLAAKFPKIRNGVNHVVGGNIIEFEAYNIKREGLEEGFKKGREDGWKEGREDGWKEGREDGWKEGREDGWKEGREDGVSETCKAVAARMIGAGRPGSEILLFTNLPRKEINAIARQLNRSVDWSKAETPA